MAHEHIIYMMLVDSAVLARDKESIVQYAPRLEELAVQDEHQPYMAVCERAFGVAHRLAYEFEEAELRLKNALSIFERIGTNWQCGRTLTELGELAAQRGQKELAKELFSSAMIKFEGLGAIPEMENVRAAMQ